MERFRITSLQFPSQDLNISFISLHGYIQTMRSSFTQIEQKATNLTVCHTYHGETHRQHLPSRFKDDASGCGSADAQLTSQTTSEKFKSRVFLITLTTYYLMCLTVRKPTKN